MHGGAELRSEMLLRFHQRPPQRELLQGPFRVSSGSRVGSGVHSRSPQGAGVGGGGQAARLLLRLPWRRLRRDDPSMLNSGFAFRVWSPNLLLCIHPSGCQGQRVQNFFLWLSLKS